MHSSLFSGRAARRRLPGDCIEAYSNGFTGGKHRPMGLAHVRNAGIKKRALGTRWKWGLDSVPDLDYALMNGVHANPVGASLLAIADFQYRRCRLTRRHRRNAARSKLAPTGAPPCQALRKCGITFSPIFFNVSSCAHCGTVPIWQMNRISSAPASISRCT